MLARLIMLSLAASLGLAAAGCNSTDDSGDAVGTTLTPLPIANQHHGQDANGITRPTVKLINSKAELDAVGSEELSAKKIDFKKTTVILLAVGEQPTSGYWANVTGAQVLGQTVFVQGVVNRPADDDITAQVLTYAYAAAEVAKVTGVISSDIQDAVGHKFPE
jgi:hypothetical protein